MNARLRETRMSHKGSAKRKIPEVVNLKTVTFQVMENKYPKYDGGKKGK